MNGGRNFIINMKICPRTEQNKYITIHGFAMNFFIARIYKIIYNGKEVKIMLLEEFIMENISWIDLVLAGTTLISVVVSILVICKSEKNTRDILAEKHNTREKEHNSLSKEHDNIKDIICDKANLLVSQQTRIETAVTNIEKQSIEDKAKMKNLSEKQIDILKSVDNIKALAEQLKNQQMQITMLENETVALKNENAALRGQLAQYQDDIEV